MFCCMGFELFTSLAKVRHEIYEKLICGILCAHLKMRCFYLLMYAYFILKISPNPMPIMLKKVMQQNKKIFLFRNLTT